MRRVIRRTSGTSSPTASPRWLHALLLLMLLASTVSQLPFTPDRVSAQGTRCLASSPTTEEYGVSICLTDPADGAVLGGTAPMSATVETLFGVPPGIREVGFYLSPAFVPTIRPIATDFQAPFTLDLPTDHWVDGSYVLEVRVEFADGFLTPVGPSAYVTLANGVTTPPGTDGSFIPKTSSTAPLHVVAVGDGGGGLSGSYDVGALANDLDPDLFFYLGDLYDAGTYTEFVNYYSPTLGALYDRTNPIVGNHEVKDGYAGYMDYWNMGSRYYSFDAGGWHVIALDSSTSGLLRPGTAQYAWLQADLAASAGTACTMVLVHHPRFTLTDPAGNGHLQDAWALLDQHGVDLYLTGHDHNYQRWLPMNAAGEVDPAGITQIVVGTGGHKRHGFAYSDARVAYRQSTDGVLSLTLTPDGASAQFIRTDGSVPDNISLTCDSGTLPATPVPVVTPTPSPTPAPAGTVLAPVADARVASGEPATNFGADPLLVADNSPEEHSYLRFEVPASDHPIASATLRVWVANGTGNAPAVAVSEDNDWDESTITWATKPSAGPPIADSGKVNRDSWLEYDVMSAVKPGQATTFVLLPQSSDGLDVHARENDAGTQPQLVIETGAATPIPAATPTPSPTAVTTPTPRPPDGNTLYPIADAIIVAAKPDENFGSSDKLGADTSPQETSYLRFAIPDGSGPLESAQLRLWVPPGSGNGTTNAPALALLDDATWDETGVTWNSGPSPGDIVADAGRVNAGTWIEYSIPGNRLASGPVSFALVPQSSDGVVIASRETLTPPELVLVPASGTPSALTTPAPTATAIPSPTAAPTLSPPAGTIFDPVADVLVREKTPDRNEGSSDVLGADLSSAETSYLRFGIPPVEGAISTATLRLWVPPVSGNGTTNAPAVALVEDNSWAEVEMTWNSKPAPGAIIDDHGRANSGTWVEYDVTGHIPPGGTVSFTLVAQSTDGVVFGSRESDTPPQLVIALSPGSSFTEPAATPAPTGSPAATPVATPTTEPPPSPTATPTQAPTPTPTPTATPIAVPTATTQAMQQTAIVATGGARLHCRTGPSLDAPIIASLDPGSTIVIRGDQEGDWLPVSCDGQDGYVYAPLVVSGTPAPAGEEGTTTVAPEAVPIARAPESVERVDTAVTEPIDVASAPAPPGSGASGESMHVMAVADVPPEPEPEPAPVTNGWQSPSALPWWTLTDGDLHTIWTGDIPPDIGVIEVGLDLGHPVPISHVRLQPTWPMQGQFELQLSNDGITWYSLAMLDMSTQVPDNWREIDVHVTARYIRLLMHAPAGAIRDIEIWPEPNGAALDVSVLPLATPTPMPVAGVPPTPAEVIVPTVPPAPPTEIPPVPTDIPPTLTPVPPEPTVAPPPVELPPPVVEPTLAAPVEAPPPDSTPGAPEGG